MRQLQLLFFTVFVTVCISAEIPAFIEKCAAGYAAASMTVSQDLTAVIDEIPKVRSTLHCSLYCLQNDLCSHSHYNEEAQQCVLTGFGTLGSTVKDFTGRTVGTPDPLTGAVTCEDMACPTDSICLYSCKDGGEPKAYCLVNTRTCGSSPQITNLHHYYMPEYSDGQDNGPVQRVPYTKIHAHTDLRVQWYATIRGRYHTSGCTRWRVLFNGTDCAIPGRIENVDYTNRHLDDKRMTDVDGICKSLTAGYIEVGIYVDGCPGYSAADAQTGWKNPRHMIIYEIDARSGIDMGCPGLSLYHEQQYAEQRTDTTDTVGHIIMTLPFVKSDADTSIFVQYIANTRVYAALTGINYCGRWYMTFNGHECSMPERVEMVLGAFSNNDGAYHYRQNPHKHFTMWGICSGVGVSTFGVSTVSIQVRIGQCYSKQNGDPPDVETGWNSWSRLMAQEVRLGQTNSVVISPDGALERLRMFNIAHHAWYRVNNNDENGLVKEVTFVKKEADSGIRLSWMGGHRIYSGGASAARWYFTIDTSECGNPGPISGVAYYDRSINYHRPGLVSGICYGISAGSHTIKYNVGQISGHGAYDAMTGWEVTSRMIIMEVFVDGYRYCSNSASTSCYTT